MTIKLIVGLQNPGSAYEHTRHNAGAWLVEAIANAYQIEFKTEPKLLGKVALLDKGGINCRLFIPNTYMNHSGQAIRAISQFYKTLPNEIVVAHDELSLECGRIKLKSGGGHGGHNGLKDTMAHLSSTDFQRLRIGIGHPGDKSLVLNYVLGKPSIADLKSITDAITRCIPILPKLIQGDMAYAMNHINT